MNRVRRQPGRDRFPARFIQDIAATAGVAVGHEAARPVATAPTLRRPWCLGCCQELPRDQCDLIPFER